MEVQGLKYVILGLVLGSVISFSNSKVCNFPAIFNFGDSNSDTGALNAAFGPLPSPYGQTFFHHPAGRYSDGRVMIDFMAESLGLPYLSAYLDSVGANFSHGANFATADSTIIPKKNNYPSTKDGFSPFYLGVQFVEFSYFKNRSLQYTTQDGVFAKLLPKADYFEKGLYTFDIGQNDLGAAYFDKTSLDQVMTLDQVKAIVPEMMAKFSKVIKGVYELGGRSFWIHNTGPLGCLPHRVRQLPIKPEQLDKYGCVISYNDGAQYLNQILKEAVIQLRKDLPLAALTYVDIYSLKYTLMTCAKELGFKDPLVPCCPKGVLFDTDPKAIIWDGTHFTELANKWIFEQFTNGSFSDPPTPLNLACP
ncbi:GDSL esterase/lipase At3g26430-like [Euphorbia lathyris]|uniref:GDSL esterase/lipase At3g26430-like n=1 Tax=Euphorbia lathyris TaxID=212925 RepID=UPI003313451F